MKKSIDHPLGVKPHMKSLGARKHEGTKARYNQLEEDIRSTLKSIDGQLKDHKKRFLSNPWSYGLM